MHNSAVLYSADSALLTAAAALQLLLRRYSKEVVWRVSLLLLAAHGSPTLYCAAAAVAGVAVLTAVAVVKAAATATSAVHSSALGLTVTSMLTTEASTLV